MGGVSPRFRQDLLAAAAEAEGVTYIDVQDPLTGKQFRFYDFEYALAMQMDGRPTDQLITWAASSYGMELTADGVEEFSRQLQELGFLEAPAAFAGGDESQPPVSHLVNEAVSQVLALPTRRSGGDDAGAFGDFPTRDIPRSEETADAEWIAAQGAHTVSSDSLSTMLPENELATPPPSTASEPLLSTASEAVGELSDGGETSHWVPPFGTDHPREPSPWATVLNHDLQPPGADPFDVQTATLEPSPAQQTVMGFGGAGPGSPPGEPFGELSPRGGMPLRISTPTPVAAAPADVASLPPRLVDAAALTPPPTPPPVAPLLPPPNLSLSSSPVPFVPFERRQPPAPDEVVMAAFQPSGAGPGETAPLRAQFRAPIEPPRASRGPKIAVVIMLVLAAAAGIAYYLWTSSVAAAAVKHVRVLSPKPTAVYRWFDGTGRVAGGESRTLAFEGGGRVTDVLPPGSSFAAGEIVARLQGAALPESDVSRHRARLLYCQQMRDSMRAANNTSELRQAEIKIGIKIDLLADAEALLAPRVIRPSEAGQVLEALVKPGDTVLPRVAALTINPGRLRGEFALSLTDAGTARALSFCRVEVAGQPPTASIAAAHLADENSAADSGPPQVGGSAHYFDCQLPIVAGGAELGGPTSGRGPGISVELPAGAAVTVGQPLRLARARFDGVFPVPRGAVVRVDDTDRVFVAAAGGIAEARAVSVADAAGDELLVTQGLDVGDAVIVDAPADLREGSRVVVDL